MCWREEKGGSLFAIDAGTLSLWGFSSCFLLFGSRGRHAAGSGWGVGQGIITRWIFKLRGGSLAVPPAGGRFHFLCLKPFFCGNVTQLDFQRDIHHSEFKTHSEFRFLIIHNTNCTTLIILTSEKHFQPQLVNFMVQGIINVLQYTQRLPALQLGP